MIRKIREIRNEEPLQGPPSIGIPEQQLPTNRQIEDTCIEDREPRRNIADLKYNDTYGEVWLWTDGSCSGVGQSRVARSAVYSGTTTCTKQPPIGHDNITAELYAIKMALEITPANERTRIFTDCKAAANMIQNLPRRSNQRYKTILLSIKSLLQENLIAGGTTKITHILAHVEMKERRHQWLETPEGKIWRAKLTQQRTEWTDQAPLVERGNKLADQLANSKGIIPTAQQPLLESDTITITDQRTNTIKEGRVRQLIRNTQQANTTRVGQTKIKTLNKLLDNTIIDQNKVPPQATPNNRKRAKNWAWLQRLKEGRLPTRHLLHKRATTYKLKRKRNRTALERMAINRYKDAWCKHCLKQRRRKIKETTEHILVDCPGGIEIHNHTTTRITRILKKIIINHKMPKFYGTQQRPAYLCTTACGELKRLPRVITNAGMQPTILSKALKEVGCPTKLITKTARRIQRELFRGTKKLWKNRCSFNNEPHAPHRT